MTATQWADRYPNTSGWVINNGTLEPAATAPVPLASQAATAINEGVTIALTGSVTLAATVFPTDVVTTGKIANVITTVIAASGFPGGATSYPMRDMSGAWHTFTIAQYTKVAAAISAYVADLDLIADGNPRGATSLPSSSITVAV
jgi:hypothetical protein